MPRSWDAPESVRDALGVEMPRVSGYLGVEMPCMSGCPDEYFEMPQSEDNPCVEMLGVGMSRESGWNNMLIMNMMHL